MTMNPTPPTGSAPAPGAAGAGAGGDAFEELEKLVSAAKED
jgi:hypothetical protein